MGMEEFMEYLPFLLPLIIIQLTLALVALVHVLKHPNYKIGNRTIWIIVVCFVQFIGPIAYFALGKGDD